MTSVVTRLLPSYALHMSSVDPNKLHFGPYRTPRFRYGRVVECEARGRVKVVGTTAGRITWPIGKTGISKAPIVFAGLARAVRKEAACAVAHWWVVGASTVNKRRRALGVPAANDGSRMLRSAYGKSPSGKPALAAMHAKARDPIRRAKIAAAKRCT